MFAKYMIGMHEPIDFTLSIYTYTYVCVQNCTLSFLCTAAAVLCNIIYVNKLTITV